MLTAAIFAIAPIHFPRTPVRLVVLPLFLFAFTLHALGGAQVAGDEQQAHGGSRPSVVGYMTGSQFWFESLQNWQSEFLAVGALAVLGIFLRQRGSPESKPVAAPHTQTGTS